MRTIDRNNQTKEITSPHDRVLNVPHLREQDVYKALYTTDASKATSFDGIPAKALKIALARSSLICSRSALSTFSIK